MTAIARSDRSDQNRKMIAGVRKHFASAPAIVVDGVSYAPADIEKVLQDSIDAADASSAAAAVFHKAVAVEKAASTKSGGLYRGLRTFLITQYKTQPTVLGDFGITLPSKQVPDASTVAAAVVKRAATRAARHTMGKRQKQAVKGTVTTTAPITAATASTPVAQSQGASVPQGTNVVVAPRVP